MPKAVSGWTYGRLQGVRYVPDAWSLVSATDVARLESGHTPARTVPSFWNGKVRWLSLHDTKNLEGHVLHETELRISELGLANSSARLLPAGTVALSRTATVGKCVILGRDMATSQDFACYVPGPRLHGPYLLHLFRHMQPVWNALAGGSTHQSVYMPVFKKLKVLLPPTGEQRRIAEILDTVDEAIRKTEEIIAKLEQVKRGLLHDLLTRGIDDNGELRDPERQPEQFKDSPLGRIPTAWDVSECGELFDTQLGKMLSKEASAGPNQAPYLANRHVQWDRVVLDSLDTMSFNASERAKFELLPGDLLVCEGGEVGRTALWRGERTGVFFQKAIHRLRPKNEAMVPGFMLRFMRFAADRGLFTDLSSQTSIAHLTQEKLALLKVPNPPVSEQKATVAALDQLDARMAEESRELSKLRLVKHGLMEDLLTGSVRVTTLLRKGAESAPVPRARES